MDWINGLFAIPSALQAVVVLSLVCTVGLGLGKIRVAGISLGIAFVFFFGIAAGSFGLQVDEQMLNYCETFGLVIFVYTLGLSVGPTFFGSFRHEGTLFNLWSLGVIFLGNHYVCRALICNECTDVKHGWYPLWCYNEYASTWCCTASIATCGA